MSKKKYWCADFETLPAGNFDENGIEYTQVCVWGLMNADDPDEYYWGISMESFIAKIKELYIKTCYFHNLAFDGRFIIDWLFNNDITAVYDYSYMQMNPDDRPPFIKINPLKFKSVETETGKLYSLKVKWDESFITTFICSYVMLNDSIAVIGETLGYPKGDYDYKLIKVYKDKSEVPQDLLIYLHRDIEIMVKGIDEMSKHYEIRATLALIGMNDFKKSYLTYHEDFKDKLSIEDWEWVKQSYRGGYCCFSPRAIKDDNENTTNDMNYIDGSSYDVNSMYCWAMSLPCPYGEMLDIPPEEGTYGTILDILVIKADIINGVLPPIIPNGLYLHDKDALGDVDVRLKELRYTFHAENFNVKIWDFEWEWWKKFYKIDYVILTKRYFKTKIIFKDWIDKIYARKVEADKSGNKYETKIHKKIMLSIYGKMGQNFERYSNGYVSNKEFEERGVLLNPRTKKMFDSLQRYHHYGKDEDIVSIPFNTKTDDLSYIPCASFVASMARTKLFSAIYANQDTFLYCDTDSIYIASKEAKDIEQHASMLGAFKPETRFSRFRVLKPKFYLIRQTAEYNKNTNEWEELTKKDESGKKIKVPYIDVIKSASVDKVGKKLLNWDNFHIGYQLENAKRSGIIIKGGIVIKNVPYLI